jgi:TRAP-type C4-dicarboxylate transport system permease small subunit
MMLAASTPTLPDNGGYIAAAYLIFLALVLIYLAIMAVKLTRLQRDVVELNELADRQQERERERVAP